MTRKPKGVRSARLVPKGWGEMGSDRTGSFGDYQPRTPSADKCAAPVEDDVEEAALGDYYVRNKDLPVVGSEVRLRTEPEDGRIVVEQTSDSVAIGLFPTKYSYLAICMARGFRYEGAVTASSAKPTPSVRVSLAPK